VADNFSIYLITDYNTFWLQSANTEDALKQPRSTIRRWFAQMGVPLDSQNSKSARLQINKNGYPASVARYAGSRIFWKPYETKAVTS
jgi:hypothetical protein